MTTKTRPTFTIVTETDAYRIERHTSTRDFDCFVTGAGYIGSKPTQQAAQRLIDDYRYQTMTRAPEQLVSEPQPDAYALAAEAGAFDEQPSATQLPLVNALSYMLNPAYSTKSPHETVDSLRNRLLSYLPFGELCSTCQMTLTNTLMVAREKNHSPAWKLIRWCVGCTRGRLITDSYADFTADPNPPAPNPLGDSEGDEEDAGEWRAQTLQSRAIESTLQRNRICANCQGAHITWQCPQIAIILFAPELLQVAA